MNRRKFLLVAATLTASGCARVPPPGAAPTPSATIDDAPSLTIGTDGTPAVALFTELLAGAIVGKGRQARTAVLGGDWQAALGHGDLAATPAFAASLWSELSQKSETPAAADLLSEVAALLAPEVSVLSAPGVDASLVWLVTQETAKAGITSLARVRGWSKGKRAAIPKVARFRADGVPGLRTVYGGQFETVVVDDPVERAGRLARGQVAVAAFRRVEYTGASQLVALADPDQLSVPDPGVVLVNSRLTDARPDDVIALQAVAEAITTDGLVDLQAHVAAGGTAAEVASRWLKEQGLA